MNGRRDGEELARLIERSSELKRDLVDFSCSPRLERSLAAAMLEAGLEGFEELMTRPHLLRPAYLRIVQQYLKDIQKGCDGGGVDYVQMLTNRPLGPALAEYLVKRLQVGRR